MTVKELIEQLSVFPLDYEVKAAEEVWFYPVHEVCTSPIYSNTVLLVPDEY